MRNELKCPQRSYKIQREARDEIALTSLNEVEHIFYNNICKQLDFRNSNVVSFNSTAGESPATIKKNTNWFSATKINIVQPVQI